jgi:hypothetical protein
MYGDQITLAGCFIHDTIKVLRFHLSFSQLDVGRITLWTGGTSQVASIDDVNKEVIIFQHLTWQELLHGHEFKRDHQKKHPMQRN